MALLFRRRVPVFSCPCQNLVFVISGLDFCHSNRHVVSHCLNLQFLNDIWCWASFHMFLYHLYNPPLWILFDKLYLYFQLVKIVLISLKILPWPVCYLELCFLISRHFRIFSYLSVTEFLFNFIVIWVHILYDFYYFIFVKVCFIFQMCGPYVVLVNVLWELEGNVYSVIVGWSQQYVGWCQSYSVDWWYCWVQLCLYWFSACWIQCAVFLIGMLKFLPAIISESSISPWSSIWVCLIYFNALFNGGSYTWGIVIFLENWPLYHYVMLFCVPDNFHWLAVCSVWN